MSDEAKLRVEAARVYRRYAIEVVEAFDLCPYARRARLDRRAEEHVLLDREPKEDAVLALLAALAPRRAVEVAFVLLPRVEVERLAFGRWVEALRKAHAAAVGAAVFAVEGFHPDARADLANPGRLVPFLRRTPDPTLQLTRLSSLEHVRRAGPHGTAFVDPSQIDFAALLAAAEAPSAKPVSDRIAEANLATVNEVGAGRVDDVVADILADRDRSYRRIDPEIVTRSP